MPKSLEQLAWLTGFTGSAGTAIVLKDKAAILVDGRYTLQAAEQLDASVFSIVATAQKSVDAWIEANLPVAENWDRPMARDQQRQEDI